MNDQSFATPAPSVFVYGPQGCGKTVHADALRRAYRLDRVVDDWQPSDAYPTRGSLILTRHAPPLHADTRRWVAFEDALAHSRLGSVAVPVEA